MVFAFSHLHGEEDTKNGQNTSCKKQNNRGTIQSKHSGFARLFSALCKPYFDKKACDFPIRNCAFLFIL